MSFGTQQAQSFFGPLVGRTTTFLLEGRLANLKFATTMAGLLAREGDGCVVLDLDAFYSSNADNIFSVMTPAAAKSAVIRVPDPGSDVEGEFSRLFDAPQKVVVIDSLNSLHHLMSQDDGSSRSRKLAFAVAALSYLARTNGKAVILSMYRREGFTRSGTGRSMSGLSDITAVVDAKKMELTVRVERGSAWPRGRFSMRSPSE